MLLKKKIIVNDAFTSTILDKYGDCSAKTENALIFVSIKNNANETLFGIYNTSNYINLF